MKLMFVLGCYWRLRDREILGSSRRSHCSCLPQHAECKQSR